MIIKKLYPNDREIIREHYANLDVKDIRSRFGSTIGQNSVNAYIEKINMTADRVFGAFFGDKLVGLLETAWNKSDVELAFTVHTEYRKMGIGHKLFDFAINEAMVSGANRIVLHLESSNVAMKRLAMSHGWKPLYNDGGQMGGYIDLPQQPVAFESESMEMKAA